MGGREGKSARRKGGSQEKGEWGGAKGPGREEECIRKRPDTEGKRRGRTERGEGGARPEGRGRERRGEGQGGPGRGRRRGGGQGGHKDAPKTGKEGTNTKSRRKDPTDAKKRAENGAEREKGPVTRIQRRGADEPR